MKRMWKAIVRIEEELEGWQDQLSSADIEDYVSEGVIRQVKDTEGVDFVECVVEEEEIKDE